MIIPSQTMFANNIEGHISHVHNNQFVFNPCFKILDNLNDKIKNEKSNNQIS